MYTDLRQKVAVVTGSSKGIGQAIAIRFGQEKMAVVVNYNHDQASARQTVAQIVAAGGRAIALQADVTTESGHQAMLQAALTNFGGLDVWVNNAGGGKSAPTHQLSLAEWNQVIAVNQTGAFLGTQAALAHFKAQQQAGNIINISSVHELIPWPTFASYAAAKGGNKLFTQTVALEYAADNIRINGIAPGAIATPASAKKLADPQQKQQLLELIPMRRVGDAAEVAAGAAWLASAESRYVTGITLFIDGGMTLYPAFQDGRG